MNTLAMPFANPNTYAGHSGVDFPQSSGTLVRASDDFTVVRRGWINNGAGNGAIVRYDKMNGLEVLYCHFNNNNYVPNIGAKGAAGTVIGSVGSTGNSTGPHLHMEIMVGRDAHTYNGIWNYFNRNGVVGVEPEYQPPARKTPPEAMLSWNWVGIQKMLKRYYGYTGAIDNKPGTGTIAAFQRFINGNRYRRLVVDGRWGTETCKGAQSWLKAKWKYTGAIDADPGAGTRKAWDTANEANNRAFS
jgi:hypothetical protein